MKKLLVIGKEGRLARYTKDRSVYDRYDISYVPVGTSDDEVIDRYGDTEFILVDAVGDVSARLMENMPSLRLIHSEGVGYQGVDTEAADRRGIYVCNCEGVNAAAVAEQTVLLMLGLLREVRSCDESVRAGRQIITKEDHMMKGDMKELGECRVGLIGFGNIAKATCRLLKAFGSDVVYTKPARLSEEEEERYGVTYMERDELLAGCDIVSLHLPVTEETRYMADAGFFDRMKRGAYLINTSRGELVKSEDLVGAIADGKIAGAGLDTIDGEPVQKDNILLKAPDDVKDRLLLSCHIGGITGASFRRAYEMIWSDIEKAAGGQRPDHIVNMK